MVADGSIRNGRRVGHAVGHVAKLVAMDAMDIADSAAAEATAADAEDACTEVLHELGEILLQSTSELSNIEHRLSRPASGQVLKEVSSQIPTLDGDVNRLQVRIDAVVASSLAARGWRRGLTEQSTALSERVQTLPARLAEVVASTVGAHKEEGNAHFKRAEYDAAIRSYTEAIGIDRKTPTLFSNRSACYQAKAMWEPAAADARECISLDVSFAKGYIHLVRSLLQLQRRDEAAKALSSAPLALRENADVRAISVTVQAELKSAGNAALKQGDHEGAIRQYTLCLSLDDSQAVYYSNRSAAHQAKRQWREAAADAQSAIKLDRTYVKAWLHLGKTRLAMGEPSDARKAVQDGIVALQEAGQPQSSCAPLHELLKTIQASTQSQTPRTATDPGGFASPQPKFEFNIGSGGGGSGGGASAGGTPGGGAAATGGSSATARAASLKEQGNAQYKSGQYGEALRLYSQAIGTCPEEGAYYGNRAACWMMLGKYERVVDDCAQGLRRATDAQPAPWVGKVRQRQATALTRLGKLERAEDVLSEGVERGGENSEALKAALKQTRELRTAKRVAEGAMEEGAHGKALTNLSTLLSHVTESTELLMLHARCLLLLRRPIDAAREAQKALALDEDLLPAYVLRADALHAMGQTDKAMKHLREALSRDPDHSEAGRTLKRLRRLVADMDRLKQTITAAMSKRLFEEAIAALGEALKVAGDDRHLTAPLYADRAKAYQRLARSREMGQTRREREAASGGGASAVESSVRTADGEAPPDEEEDPRAGANACWRRCLQDCSTAVYEDCTLLEPYLLRAEALQSMERWGEALGVLEACLNSEPSRRQDQRVLEKVAEAQFLVKKSERKDLYGLLGVKGVGSKASEREIRAAYKRAALDCHPDRMMDSSNEEIAAAEAKFKELGEALDVLTDEFKRKLWDEGHDLESIAQRVQMRDQQRGGGGGGPP